MTRGVASLASGESDWRRAHLVYRFASTLGCVFPIASLASRLRGIYFLRLPVLVPSKTKDLTTKNDLDLLIALGKDKIFASKTVHNALANLG
ncbi:hypothetical protein V6N11_061187 [Hibiscus sabdariffa]|uniref:Uncharacterized protein n=2 Tax=Hibiscus sabdariffa TaxID=183260 RepID=A0ABR2DHP2_9ROSI